MRTIMSGGVARGDYGWLTPELPIYRDYGLDDLRPLLGGITATVLVQAAPTEAETWFMLETARGSGGLVRAVVGWTDLAAPKVAGAGAGAGGGGAVEGPAADAAGHRRDRVDPARSVQPGLRAMTEAGLRFDALIQPRHLPMMLRLCARHPDLPVVIDHAAKPDIAHGGSSRGRPISRGWRARPRRSASCPGW